MNTHKTILG